VIRRRATRVVLAGCAALAAFAGCGVDTDGRPRDIQPEERPADAAQADDGQARPGTGSTVYFLGPANPGSVAPLTAAGRAGRANATDLLSALFEGPSATEQDDQGLRTAIPPGTAVRSATVDAQGTLQVDVSAELLLSAGDVLLDAVAQIVFTASSLKGVERIRLLVDGAPQDWPTSSGDSTGEPLTVFDYPDRIPTSQPAYPALPSAGVTSTAEGPPGD
jgi:spore germination protein GerM